MRVRSGLGRLLGGAESRCRPVRLGILHIILSASVPSTLLNLQQYVLHMLGFPVDRLGLTIRMPHLTDEFHRRWRERIIFGELELSGEDTAFKWRPLGPLNQRFPV